MSRIFPILTVFLLTACSDFPDLDDRVSERAQRNDFPTLRAIDGMFDDAINPDGRDIIAETQSLKERAARLRRRAKALRKPVIDRITRRKFAEALKRSAKRRASPVAKAGGTG